MKTPTIAVYLIATPILLISAILAVNTVLREMGLGAWTVFVILIHVTLIAIGMLCINSLASCVSKPEEVRTLIPKILPPNEE